MSIPPLPQTGVLYGIGVLRYAGIGIEWFKFSVRLSCPLLTSNCLRPDGETPLRQPRTAAPVDMKQLSEFSPYLSKAVVASEDSHFTGTLGLIFGYLRAVAVNLRGGLARHGATQAVPGVCSRLCRSRRSGSAATTGKWYAPKLEPFFFFTVAG